VVHLIAVFEIHALVVHAVGPTDTVTEELAVPKLLPWIVRVAPPVPAPFALVGTIETIVGASKLKLRSLQPMAL
jgi:hypothetical protein